MAGLLHLRLAKAAGAAKVHATDIVDFRKEAARRAGADVVLDGRDDVPSKVRDANEGRLADLVITCTGAPQAIGQGFLSVDRGGTILFFAPTDPDRMIPIPFNALWREEVTITSSYGASPGDVEAALALLRAGKVRVSDLITHRFPLAEAAEGFRIVAAAEDSLKVVLHP